jgi:hypothetical protein
MTSLEIDAVHRAADADLPGVDASRGSWLTVRRVEPADPVHAVALPAGGI